MRIGILTFHRALNYGAVLQCYALQSVLQSLGHDVKVIDYRQPDVELAYKPIVLSWLLKKLPFPHKLLPYLKDAARMRRRHKLFKPFEKQYLSLTSNAYTDSIPDDFDAYVVGSDQVWRLCQDGRPDRFYSGDFARGANSRLIGYAVSSTQRSVETMGAENLGHAIGRFDSFSFREANYASLTKKMTGLDVETTIDPTLLVDEKVWHEMADSPRRHKKYVLVYEVRTLAECPDMLIRRATALAGRIGAEVVDVSRLEIGVGEFVSYFRNAAAVVTSSFHATAFSIIFERPFYTYVLNDGKDSRYVDLLTSLGLSDLLKTKDDELMGLPDVDFLSAKKILTDMRAASMDFLTHALTDKR